MHAGFMTTAVLTSASAREKNKLVPPQKLRDADAIVMGTLRAFRDKYGHTMRSKPSRGRASRLSMILLLPFRRKRQRR